MAAAWMLLAAFLFASMGVCVKAASDFFSSYELVFYRGLVSTLFMGWFAYHRGIGLKTRFLGMHIWRSIVGVISLGTWFYALGRLPLATAMTLNYMSSVWVAAFVVGSAMLRPPTGPNADPAEHWQRQLPLMVTVLTGFMGVIMVLRPTFEAHQAFAGLIGLMSGFVASFAYMQVMALARVGEPEERTVFWFSVGTTAVGVGLVAATGVSDWAGWHSLWLLPIGLFASLGQLCMTRAYSHGATLVVANLQYSGIIYAAMFGWLLFGEAIPLIGWAGIGLIIVSGIASSVIRKRMAVRPSPT
jgi:drug/metabolite transporter (DMT)-like permease